MRYFKTFYSDGTYDFVKTNNISKFLQEVPTCYKAKLISPFYYYIQQIIAKILYK